MSQRGRVWIGGAIVAWLAVIGAIDVIRAIISLLMPALTWLDGMGR